LSIIDRYASAVRSSNLRSRPDTTKSDTDVLGAVGLAAKRTPLAMALLRLFVGDGSNARAVSMTMADMVSSKAEEMGVMMIRLDSVSIGSAVLAWHRDGRCKACNGLGFKVFERSPTLSDQPCDACRGTTKVPFDTQFDASHLDLARWLLVQLEREMAIAGSDAMKSLAPRLEL
jgi:hypothetical protein